ncbi:cell division protein ZapA [Aureimonas sp. AU4]|jgi:cell division protein ZapA|uniref:cell division protein ZapA n=1 Tax=Aureimonas sp. AU4 TaxID=1638163 RepID=UPI0007816D14|nr:cell division protein ZapA [Aureimonas sp. AU4]
MPQIVVTIDAKTYRMACAEGEEEHLVQLAAQMDARINELRGSFGEIGDQRLAIMAGIMASDELSDARGRIADLEAELAEARERERDLSRGGEAGDRRLAEHLNGVSDVLDEISAKLEDYRR